MLYLGRDYVTYADFYCLETLFGYLYDQFRDY